MTNTEAAFVIGRKGTEALVDNLVATLEELHPVHNAVKVEHLSRNRTARVVPKAAFPRTTRPF